ncbi:hypothetical protein ACHAXA_011437 [Cyclostephanos tholiformis]|uniref:Hyaluronan/mRNA-binding protein domain-containing protein n=1 Tax=Cyclostephanos tholiformis TaxID=382380 RepID=A0ABD3RVV6_9STRA
MSNFFAALDDSDNEGKAPASAVAKKKEKAPHPMKKEVVEPSKVESRPSRNDRDKKGGRGGRIPARDGKRAYDRRSGTGRGKEIKKEGGGGHNWGSDKIDAKKAEGPVTEGEEINTPEEEPEKEVAEEVEDKEPEPEPEPEDTTISYDEYLAMKARPNSEAFKPLEARKVEDEFAGKAPTKKETSDFLVMGGGKQPKKKGSVKKEPEKLVLDFKIKSTISDDREGGRREGRRDGGRGGRREGGERREGRGGGGGRGSGGRSGGDRGDRGGRRERGGRGGGGGGGGGRGNKGLDTLDASAFPSL